MKLYKIALSLFLGLILCCCDKDATESNSPTSGSSIESQSSVNSNRLVADTLNGMKEKMKELETELSKVSLMASRTKSDMDLLKAKLDGAKSNKIQVIFICGVLGLIGIVMAIAAFYVANKQKKRLNRHRSDIEGLKKQFSNFNNTTIKPNSTTSHVPSSEYSELLRRMSSLEKEFRTLPTTNISQNVVPQQDSMSVVEPYKNTRHGYFGTAIVGEGGKGYFKKLLDNKEDARFSVHVADENAEFEPIVQIDAITSIDAMDLAIEFEGVSKSEATNMSVKQNGRARFVDEKWIITQKAVVILKK